MNRKLLFVAALLACVTGFSLNSADACSRRRCHTVCVPVCEPICCIPCCDQTPTAPTAKQIFEQTIAEVKAFADDSEDTKKHIDATVKEIEDTWNAGEDAQKEWIDAYATPAITDDEQKSFEKYANGLGDGKAAEVDRWQKLSNAGKRYYLHLFVTSGETAWLLDYAQGLNQVVVQNKPLAVVFGTGANSGAKALQTAVARHAVSQILANHYICVYVDTASATGKELSKRFGITKATGLVLSDRSGEKQAFWHEGSLSNSRIASYLRKYADPLTLVESTEKRGSPRNLSRAAIAAVPQRSFTVTTTLISD